MCLLNSSRHYRSYCSTVHFCRITSIYQPTNAHIISHKTLLKHFKTLRHVSILSDHHQEAYFLAKIMLQYSQFNSYLQTRCCGSISCCVGMCCGAVARCASKHTWPMPHNTFLHNMVNKLPHNPFSLTICLYKKNYHALNHIFVLRIYTIV